MFNFELSQFKTFDRELAKLSQKISSHKDEVVMPYYFQKLQSITFYAHQAGQQQIRDATTLTGKRRAANGGGEPGRIETGKFIEGFKLDNGKKLGESYEFEIGWIDGSPSWAVYQEIGFLHRGGMVVTGADALGETARFIENEIRKLK